jgi:hypothetical protein
MAEHEVCDWITGHIGKQVNETELTTYLVDSCKNDSFPDFVCTFISKHIDDIYTFLFGGQLCDYIIGC